MSVDRSPALAHSFGSELAKWGVILGVAVVVGVVLGLVITTFPRPDTHVWVDRDLALSIDGYPAVIASELLLVAIEAMAAGSVIGLAGALAVGSRSLLAALAGGIVAAGSAATAIVLCQWQRGRWPVGTIDPKMFFAAAALVVLVCSAAFLASIAGRLHSQKVSKNSSPRNL